MRRSKQRPQVKSVTEALAALVDELPGHGGTLDTLKLKWSALCGPALARFTEPKSLLKGRLDVMAYGPHWRDALEVQRQQILARVRRIAPEVTWIWIRTGPPKIIRVTPTPPVEPDPRNADVEDEALRGALDALCAAVARRNEEER